MKDVVFNGNIAYAKIDSSNTLIKQLIKKYEYPAYSFDIIFNDIDEKAEDVHDNSFWQRVPELDKTEDNVEK